MNAPHRRGACPGLAVPMQTGDGWLVRLASLGADIGLDAAAALGAAARRHGNGIIEVTARGSIQVRGLTPASAPDFADSVAALGIAARDGVAILVDPLAGLAPAPADDSGRLADALRRRLAAASFTARLGPKISVVVDGGAALHLDAMQADIRLRAQAAGAEWQVALGGDAQIATPLGAVAAPHAVEAAARLLAAIALHGPGARAKDLVRGQGAASLRAAIADLLVDSPSSGPRAESDPIGAHALRDGRLALGIGLAFGHTDADGLDGLIEAAKGAGARGLRTAPARALLIIGVAADTIPKLTAAAESRGFITRRDDARRRVVACAGAPVCAAAQIPARRLGPMISAAAPALLDGSLTVHVSGCPKGCAHPASAALTIVGGPDGCGLVIGGSARDPASAHMATAALSTSLGRLAAEVAPGEKAADTLARLGPARIAAILGATHHG